MVILAMPNRHITISPIYLESGDNGSGSHEPRYYDNVRIATCTRLSHVPPV